MKTEKQITMSLDLAKQMLGKDGEMDMLIKQNFSDEELGIKPKLPKRWEDIDWLDGYFISSESHIKPAYCIKEIIHENKNMLPTKKLAEAMLALCQLLYLRDIYNEGWKPDWDDNTRKYGIAVFKDTLIQDYIIMYQHILVFKTEELRNEFMNNFKDLLEIAKPLL